MHSLGWSRESLLRTRGRSTAVVAAGALVAAIAGAALSIWPTFSLALVVLAAVVVLAARCPGEAFVVAIAAFALEGTLKIRLSEEGSPSGLAGNELGAVLLDLAFVIALVGLVRRERLACVRRWWGDASRPTKAAFGLLVVWLAASVAQIPHGGLRAGLEGFRLVPFYVVALYGGLATAALVGARRLVVALVWTVGIAAAYAAVRGVIGPADIERAFALARPTTAVVPSNGADVFRNVGSFSSAVGLASYLTTGAALAALTALSIRRRRGIAAVVFALAVVGLATAYVRSSLVAVAVAVALAGAGVALAQSRTRHERVVAAVVVIAMLLGSAAFTVAIGRASPEVAARTRSVLHPLSDSSMRDRFDTWRDTLDRAREHPFGTGLGTAGSAASRAGLGNVTTDSSYLLVLREQGFVPAAAFAAAIFGLIGAIAARLFRRRFSAAGAASLAGFAAFALLCANGDYVEEPGKVLAWTLLGVALWETASGTDAAVAPRRAMPRIVPFLLLGTLTAALAAALAASRPDRYLASVDLYPSASPGVPSPGDPRAYVERLLRNERLVREVRLRPALTGYRPSAMTVHTSGPTNPVIVVASAPTPSTAAQLANVLRLQVPNVSKRDTAARLRTQRRRVERVLASTTGERPALRRRLQRLRAAEAAPAPRIQTGHLAVPPPAVGVDRVLELLPGPLPRGPATAWAAVAALLAVGAAFVTQGRIADERGS